MYSRLSKNILYNMLNSLCARDDITCYLNFSSKLDKKKLDIMRFPVMIQHNEGI